MPRYAVPDEIKPLSLSIYKSSDSLGFKASFYNLYNGFDEKRLVNA